MPLSGAAKLAQHDANVVNCAVVGERNICRSCQELSIQFRKSYAASDTGRILYFDPIRCRVVAKINGVAGPVSRYARIDAESHAAHTESQHPLQASVIARHDPGELTVRSGGLNGSTQHSARTHLALKTKAK